MRNLESVLKSAGVIKEDENLVVFVDDDKKDAKFANVSLFVVTDDELKKDEFVAEQSKKSPACARLNCLL